MRRFSIDAWVEDLEPVVDEAGLERFRGREPRPCCRYTGRVGAGEPGVPADVHDPVPAVATEQDVAGDLLTAREIEILRCVAAGMTNRAIAERLFVSVRTVERHMGDMYGKLGLEGKSGRAVIAARAASLIGDPQDAQLARVGPSLTSRWQDAANGPSLRTDSWVVAPTRTGGCRTQRSLAVALLSEPTEDECTVLVGWHVEQGHADEVTLDGLNVALAVRSPGHMAQVLTADGRRRSLRIGDVGSVDIEAIEGQHGEAVTVTGHPLCIAPGHDAVVARSEQLSYHDHGLEWELSEKNGFFSPSAYQP